MPSLQTVEVVEAQEKDTKLQGLLTKHHKSRTNRILIFVLYKKEAARVEGALHRKGWKVQHFRGLQLQGCLQCASGVCSLPGLRHNLSMHAPADHPACSIWQCPRPGVAGTASPDEQSGHQACLRTYLLAFRAVSCMLDRSELVGAQSHLHSILGHAGHTCKEACPHEMLMSPCAIAVHPVASRTCSGVPPARTAALVSPAASRTFPDSSQAGPPWIGAADRCEMDGWPSLP